MSGLPPFCILEYFEELWNIIDMNVAMWRNILTVIVAIGIGILIGWLCRGFNPPQTKTDTMLVAVRDTTSYMIPHTSLWTGSRNTIRVTTTRRG